jgi:hypothetical protein
MRAPAEEGRASLTKEGIHELLQRRAKVKDY